MEAWHTRLAEEPSKGLESSSIDTAEVLRAHTQQRGRLLSFLVGHRIEGHRTDSDTGSSTSAAFCRPTIDYNVLPVTPPLGGRQATRYHQMQPILASPRPEGASDSSSLNYDGMRNMEEVGANESLISLSFYTQQHEGHKSTKGAHKRHHNKSDNAALSTSSTRAGTTRPSSRPATRSTSRPLSAHKAYSRSGCTQDGTGNPRSGHYTNGTLNVIETGSFRSGLHQRRGGEDPPGGDDGTEVHSRAIPSDVQGEGQQPPPPRRSSSIKRPLSRSRMLEIPPVLDPPALGTVTTVDDVCDSTLNPRLIIAPPTPSKKGGNSGSPGDLDSEAASLWLEMASGKAREKAQQYRKKLEERRAQQAAAAGSPPRIKPDPNLPHQPQNDNNKNGIHRYTQLKQQNSNAKLPAIAYRPNYIQQQHLFTGSRSRLSNNIQQRPLVYAAANRNPAPSEQRIGRPLPLLRHYVVAAPPPGVGAAPTPPLPQEAVLRGGGCAPAPTPAVTPNNHHQQEVLLSPGGGAVYHVQPRSAPATAGVVQESDALCRCCHRHSRHRHKVSGHHHSRERYKHSNSRGRSSFSTSTRSSSSASSSSTSRSSTSRSDSSRCCGCPASYCHHCCSRACRHSGSSRSRRSHRRRKRRSGAASRRHRQHSRHHHRRRSPVRRSSSRVRTKVIAIQDNPPPDHNNLNEDGHNVVEEGGEAGEPPSVSFRSYLNKRIVNPADVAGIVLTPDAGSAPAGGLHRLPVKSVSIHGEDLDDPLPANALQEPPTTPSTGGRSDRTHNLCADDSPRERRSSEPNAEDIDHHDGDTDNDTDKMRRRRSRSGELRGGVRMPLDSGGSDGEEDSHSVILERLLTRSVSLRELTECRVGLLDDEQHDDHDDSRYHRQEGDDEKRRRSTEVRTAKSNIDNAINDSASIMMEYPGIMHADDNDDVSDSSSIGGAAGLVETPRLQSLPAYSTSEGNTAASSSQQDPRSRIPRLARRLLSNDESVSTRQRDQRKATQNSSDFNQSGRPSSHDTMTGVEGKAHRREEEHQQQRGRSLSRPVRRRTNKLHCRKPDDRYLFAMVEMGSMRSKSPHGPHSEYSSEDEAGNSYDDDDSLSEAQARFQRFLGRCVTPTSAASGRKRNRGSCRRSSSVLVRKDHRRRYGDSSSSLCHHYLPTPCYPYNPSVSSTSMPPPPSVPYALTVSPHIGLYNPAAYHHHLQEEDSSSPDVPPLSDSAELETLEGELEKEGKGSCHYYSQGEGRAGRAAAAAAAASDAHRRLTFAPSAQAVAQIRRDLEHTRRQNSKQEEAKEVEENVEGEVRVQKTKASPTAASRPASVPVLATLNLRTKRKDEMRHPVPVIIEEAEAAVMQTPRSTIVRPLPVRPLPVVQQGDLSWHNYKNEYQHLHQCYTHHYPPMFPLPDMYPPYSAHQIPFLFGFSIAASPPPYIFGPPPPFYFHPPYCCPTRRRSVKCSME